MYFFDITAAKQRFVENGYTERQLLPYIVINAALMSYYQYFGSPRASTFGDYSLWCYYVLGIIAVAILYIANGGNSGRKFLEKYFVIGWVVSVRFFCLFVSLLLCIELVKHYSSNFILHSKIAGDIATAAASLLFYGYFYWNLVDLRKRDLEAQDSLAQT